MTDSPDYSYAKEIIRTLNDQLNTYIPSAVTNFINNASGNTIIAQVEQAITSFATAGKHIRPSFAWAGFFCSSKGNYSQLEDHNREHLLQLGTACELLHTSALIHDDIIDASPSRRGQPTVHIQFEQAHHSHQWQGSGAHYGASLGILSGDIALCIANSQLSLLNSPTLWRIWAHMEQEVSLGQILDVAYAAEGKLELEATSQVNYLKTASYSFIRPLQLGAALGGASEELLHQLAAIGATIGGAFQLQDDVLGVFGDPATTGKSQGDDLKSGKSTQLIITALEQARSQGSGAYNTITTGLGAITSEAHLHEVIEAIESVGAKAIIEQKIAELFNQTWDLISVLPQDYTGPSMISYLCNQLWKRAF